MEAHRLETGSNAAESSRTIKKRCHQCRNLKPRTVPCTNQRKTGKMCPLLYCSTCLTRRYEKEKEVKSGLDKWICPRCREICTCSKCTFIKNREPIAAKRKASGMSRVPDLNIIPEDAIGQDQAELTSVDMAAEHVGKAMNPTNSVVSGAAAKSSNGNKKSCHQCRRIKSNTIGCTDQRKAKICSLVYCSNCLTNRYGKQIDVIRSLHKWMCPRCEDICDCSVCKKRAAKGQATGTSRVSETQIEIIPEDAFEQYQELTSVVGIDMAAEHVGKALQFLEFCEWFGEILGLTKLVEPKIVLQNVLDEKANGRWKYSAAIKFQIHLLKIIQQQRKEKVAGSSSKRKSKILCIDWFDTLKRFYSGSQSVLVAAQGFGSLDEKAGYNALNSSERLILLIFLCDEVLQTKKVKNYINGKVAGAKKAVTPGPKKLRTEPFYNQKGHVFWKLNVLAESDVLLCQNIGKGDDLMSDDKWSSVNAASKEAIEKHISVSR